MALRTSTSLPFTAALFLFASLVAGCGGAQKPPPPPPPEKTPWEEPKATKDPPKCEALKEKCEASAATKARITKSTFALTPIKGWTYAQTEGALVAQASDAGGAMAVVGYENANAKEDIKNREAGLEAGAKEIGVTLGKKKVAWKAPIDTLEASGLKIPLYELEGATRKDKKGTLLVFATTFADNKGGFVGFSFVPDGDPDADKIVEAIQTSIKSVIPQDKKPADGKK